MAYSFRHDYAHLIRTLFHDTRSLPKELYRFCRYWFQWFTNGFSDDELWNLDSTLASFILPRLRRFKQITHGYPPELTEKEWDEVLDKIIRAMELIDPDRVLTNKDELAVIEGLQLLGKYFCGLWD